MASAAERAYESIRDAIRDGRFDAGHRLREEQLSSELGVSRTPIREALRQLSAEGIVEFLPHRGAHVASWTDRELADIFELRSLIESHAAGRAAARLSSDDIDRLDELAGQMEQLDIADPNELEQVAVLNTEFHSIIVNSHSELLVNFSEMLVQIPLVHRTFARYSERDLLRSFSHHRELVDAFRARDAEWAESVMESHVLAARHLFVNGDTVNGDTVNGDTEDDQQR